MISKIKKMIPESLHVRFKLLLHKGDRYICPFCGYSAKDLFPYGYDSAVLEEKQVIGGSLRKAGCYKCGSSDRERLIYIYLKERMHLFTSDKQKKILHIAPESNLSAVMLNIAFDEYVCGDLFTEGYNYPKHVKNINILDIPYSDNYFDLLICNHVLEHIPDDLRAMRELNRVLKEGGKAILQVPISKILSTTFEDFSVTTPKQREAVFGQFDHVRIYGQDYTERLEISGFKVKRINISDSFKKYGLNKEEDIFECEKQVCNN